MPKFVQKSREEVLNASMALTAAERMANRSGNTCCTAEFRPTRNGPCAEVVSVHGALRRLASLEAASEAGDGAGALPGFFPLTPKPSRGDWLAEREESGQTFTSYAKQTPVNVATPHATFNTILIVLISGSPVDAVAAAENTASSLTFSPQLQHDLRAYIEAFYYPLRVEFIEAALQQPKNSEGKTSLIVARVPFHDGCAAAGRQRGYRSCRTAKDPRPGAGSARTDHHGADHVRP
jgi:hypothetical protein